MANRCGTPGNSSVNNAVRGFVWYDSSSWPLKHLNRDLQLLRQQVPCIAKSNRIARPLSTSRVTSSETISSLHMNDNSRPKRATVNVQTLNLDELTVPEDMYAVMDLRSPIFHKHRGKVQVLCSTGSTATGTHSRCRQNTGDLPHVPDPTRSRALNPFLGAFPRAHDLQPLSLMLTLMHIAWVPGLVHDLPWWRGSSSRRPRVISVHWCI